MRHYYTFKVAPGVEKYDVVCVLRNQHTNTNELMSSSPRSTPKSRKTPLGPVENLRKVDEEKFLVRGKNGDSVELQKVCFYFPTISFSIVCFRMD